jgi:methionyl-tRNA formyltransferase
MESPQPPPASDATDQRLRVVFMGTPALAAHILERLIVEPDAPCAVVGAVTRPDQPRKRGLKLEPSEVGAVAERHGIPTLKPAKIRTPEFLAELQALSPDVLAVAAYGRILPNPVLEAARIMPLNVHASLLPRHRGAAPIEGAILAGDEESGITIMRVIEQMDAGPILLQRSIPLAADETQGSLKAKLADLGAAALIEALRLLNRASLPATPQDETLATYTSQVKKDDALINWGIEAAVIERMTRAYDPWPVARTSLAKEDLLVWRARALDGLSASSDSPPGTVLALSPNPVVQCGRGALALLEVQAPGRRRMPAADFMRGRRAAIGARLGA